MHEDYPTSENSLLIIVDVQGKLALSMYNRSSLMANLERLVESAPELNVPLAALEQLPEKLGATLPPLAEKIANAPLFEKRSFSVCGQPEFLDYLSRMQRRHLFLAGIETHVCIYQSARDLQKAGYSAYVVADAVSSRTENNYRLGLEMCRAAGARLTTTETTLFEWLGSVDHPAFRNVVRRVR